MDKETSLNHLIQTRDHLLGVVKEIHASQMVNRKLEGSWTGKDILGHITAWDITLLDPLNKLASGGSFVPDNIPDGELYNLQQAEMRHEQDLSEVIEEMKHVRSEILNTCEKLPDIYFERTYPAPWGGEDTLAGMLNGLAWHENEHLESIQRLKATIDK